VINSRQKTAAVRINAGLLALLLGGMLPLPAQAAPVETCAVRLGTVAVAVTVEADRLDITVTDGSDVLTRMDVAGVGALRGCWALDLDADATPELLISTAALEPDAAPELRGWKWLANAFESLDLAPLTPARPLPAATREDLKLVAGELVRSFRQDAQGTPIAHFRYDRAARRWVTLQALRPTPSGAAADSVDALLQAPVSPP
jgi:hypothetical protein